MRKVGAPSKRKRRRVEVQTRAEEFSYATKRGRTPKVLQRVRVRFWIGFLQRFPKGSAGKELSLVAAKARDIWDRQARERQVAAQNNDAARAVKENLPEQTKGQSRDQAGKALGISGKTVDFATKVIKYGTPELVAAGTAKYVLLIAIGNLDRIMLDDPGLIDVDRARLGQGYRLCQRFYCIPGVEVGKGARLVQGFLTR
ncbi:hypothetical protein [Desulfofustis glycolicus]|uniref:hypothetical protein n=1 Tax=Desulfofustis glycolicus TaxID=51195 RepID=UPI001160E62B|nr:hypothetical protein [Desulfofustis glycolicus]